MRLRGNEVYFLCKFNIYIIHSKLYLKNCIAFSSRAETFSSAVFRYIGALYDSANTDLRRGMPRMWWSFLPFTSDLQQTTIISCKLIYIYICIGFVALLIAFVCFAVYQEQMKRMKNGFSSNSDGNVHRNVTMVSTRVLPPGRSLYCPSNSNYTTLL